MMEEIMLVVAGMSPITVAVSENQRWGAGHNVPMPLQEPAVTWRPLVMVLPVQKLMKLSGSLELSASYRRGGSNSRSRV